MEEGYSSITKIFRSATGERGLTSVRSRSKENNTQLFSNTLAPLRYPDGLRSNANPILRLCESQRGVREPLTVAKNKGHPTRSVLIFWRRKRDSNPRAFWANGFQDRLVVTASIFLHIIMHASHYDMQSYFEVARETRFTNPLRIPHAAVSSSLVSGKCGYLRQRRNIPITMQKSAIISLLNFYISLQICEPTCINKAKMA